MSEDNNYLLLVRDKHEEDEKYIYLLGYSNWSTWSCIHEKSAIKVAAKIFIKLLKKSVVMSHEFLGALMLSKNDLEYSKDVLPGEIKLK